MAPRDPRDRLIVALDVETPAQADRLTEQLEGQVRHFKIGSQLFTAAGPTVVEAVQKRGAEVFLDLKFHDIPNTVAAAAREATRLGVFMFNVHASGGRVMMKAAADGAMAAARELSVRRPLVIAVTVLDEPRPRHAPPRDRRSPRRWKGMCSVSPSSPARPGSTATWPLPTRSPPSDEAWARTGSIVTPGVRPAGSAADDQSRIATPAAAARAGAHYLVIGRPIIGAPDPAKAAQAVLAEMGS